LILTVAQVVVNNAAVPPGDNYDTEYAQGFNADKIEGPASITNVDHCPRYAMSQQYCAGWNAGYPWIGIRGRSEINNAKNNVVMVVMISSLIYISNTANTCNRHRI
jgi:hypothetical protein